MRLVLALLVVSSAAHADSIATSTTEPAVRTRIALAVNEPLGWSGANALGLSAYGTITDHQVIRLNVATWAHRWLLGAEDFAGFVLSGGDGDGSGGGGRYSDFGASWMYFPRRAFDGASVELGALVRRRSTWDYTVNEASASDTTTVDSTLIGARSLVGWSWLFYDRAFISLQAGVAVGREFGTQTATHVDEEMPPVTSNLHQTTVSGEAFMRFGVIL